MRAETPHEASRLEWFAAVFGRTPSVVPATQRGVALVMAMIMLLILTLLGVAAMSTATLEEKMAGNIQEQTRAFEAAESGINSILADSGVLNPSGTVTKTYSYAGMSGSATVVSSFISFSPPSRTSIGSASGTNTVQMADFDIQSTGKTPTSAKSVNYQGVQITAPASN